MRRDRNGNRGRKVRRELNAKHGKSVRNTDTGEASHDGIHEIVPTWDKIGLTPHALQRFVQRADAADVDNRDTLVWLVKSVVVHGRRSDRDFKLVRELRHWTDNMNWRHGGRRVVLFFLVGIGVLVVQDKHDAESVIALTCFTTDEFVDVRESSAKLACVIRCLDENRCVS